jgi:hypothetical protein
MIMDEPKTGWNGTWEIMQNIEFAKIIARHGKVTALDLGGLILLIRKLPVIGFMNGSLSSPEAFGSYQLWREKLDHLSYGSIKIHTNQYIAPLSDCRLSPDDNYTMYFDLSSGIENLLNKFKNNCRKSIKIGLDKGVQIRECRSEEELEVFYGLVLKISDSGRKYDVPSYALIKEIYRSAFGKLLLAVHDNEIIGGYFLLLTRNICGWLGGIDKDFYHLTSGNLLLYETIRWGCANGYGCFSVGDQSLSLIPGITKFKMSFSPTLIPAYSYLVPKSKAKVVIFDFLKRLANKRPSMIR